MVGEQQVTTIVAVGLQRVDNVGRSQTGQVLPTLGQTHAVAHNPTHGIGLDIQQVNGSWCQENALAGVNIGLLEPCYGVLLVSRACGIVFWHEHGHLRLSRRTHIGQAVGSKQL